MAQTNVVATKPHLITVSTFYIVGSPSALPSGRETLDFYTIRSAILRQPRLGSRGKHHVSPRAFLCIKLQIGGGTKFRRERVADEIFVRLGVSPVTASGIRRNGFLEF